MDLPRNLGKEFLNQQIDKFNNEYIAGNGSEITLTDNEIKDIMKVVKSLENRETSLKGTARKITSQEGGFLNFLKSLMTAGLPSTKKVLTPLAKSVLIPLVLTAAAAAAAAAAVTPTAIQKKLFGSGATALIISNE